jgi:signal transduction histidine kinase
MSHDLQTVIVAAAAAIDTALLVSLLERRNLRMVTIPIMALLVAAWLFHTGEFLNLLLSDARGDWAEVATCFAMSSMSAGLLLMPSSLLHGILRLWRSGIQFNVPRSIRYAGCYLPMLLLPAAIRSLVVHPDQQYLDRLASWIDLYVGAVCVLNIAAIMIFLAHRRRTNDRELRKFLVAMAVLATLVTGLLVFAFWIADRSWLAPNSPLLLALSLAPLAPTLVFIYFVVRYRFMQLVVERTLVYGAILASALMLHRLVVQHATGRLGDQFHIDFGIVEGILIFLLVLLYQPFRRRVLESLRYLLGRNVSDIRERTRRLAVEMWQHVHDDTQSMVDWFVAALRESWEVKLASAWLFESSGTAVVRSGDYASFSEAQAQTLHGKLLSHSFVSDAGYGTQDLPTIDLLRQMQGSFAVRLDHAGFSGLLLLGRRSRAREYSEEEMNAIMLLAELFGVTLHNHYLHSQRLLAERLAAQNEKLSALGMLTSCLAHEIKNPLSSIKTIATVLSEQFGPEHPHGEDLRLILGEVDRLANRTNQFLKFARPANPTAETSAVGQVVHETIQILSSLAHGRGVQIESCCQPDLPRVTADENTLREIVFNLLLNAIEAGQSGGHVRVEVHRNSQFVVTSIRDDGPGITTEMQERIFNPFVTNKPSGTGLGLYIVRRYVEHLGGQIACESHPGEETCFTVKLPFEH